MLWSRLAGFGLALAPWALLGWVPAQPKPKDAVRAVMAGAPLQFRPGQGYLVDLLARLEIDPSSQTLVFSKSSLQTDHIGPQTPRALYFNAHTYVGWIPGAPLIEIMTVGTDARVRFYTISNTGPKIEWEQPTGECFRCHGGAGRLFVRSTPTPASGYPRALVPSRIVGPQTPFSERWAGWYVTGQHGAMRHLGNELSVGEDANHTIDSERGANVTDLRRYFDPRPYLTPHSDLVALMVAEMQMDVHNELSELARSGDSVEPLVLALLCSGEAPLASPIRGTADFATAYARGIPKDPKGRSLADLDLQSRLLKYPCNPVIYSEAFDGLPKDVRGQIFARLRAILRDGEGGRAYAHLSAADRAAIGEILQATKPEYR
jgi:hypothetical protein